MRADSKYSKIKTLGVGASCRVRAVRNKETGKKFAMKMMDKDKPANESMFENEVMILKMLPHINILELVESFEDKKTFNIVTKLYQGGELFNKVKSKHFSEKDATRLTKEMLLALDFCHKRNVVHRDLKPENFVFETREPDSTMKLIDFGCARHCTESTIIKDIAGSPYYVAPEVLESEYEKRRTGKIWKAADMWSVGVIVYLFVCGYPPFNAATRKEMFKKIKRGKFKFQVDGLSDSVKDLITKLLVKNPQERLTAEQALEHPWIATEIAPSQPLPATVVNSLQAFSRQCRLKKAVGRVLAHQMIEDDQDDLMDVFKQFDKNGDGRLGADEIAEMMKSIGSSEVDAKNLMAEMDQDGDGTISQEEFAAAHVAKKLGDDEGEIKKSFNVFDADGDGFVSHAEIEKLCHFLQPEVVKELISEVDGNNDGKINFNEWLEAMKDIQAKGGVAGASLKSVPE